MYLVTLKGVHSKTILVIVYVAKDIQELIVVVAFKIVVVDNLMKQDVDVIVLELIAVAMEAQIQIIHVDVDAIPDILEKIVKYLIPMLFVQVFHVIMVI